MSGTPPCPPVSIRRVDRSGDFVIASTTDGRAKIALSVTTGNLQGIFQPQVEWAKDTGSEFVIATFHPAVAALLDRFHAHAYLTAPPGDPTAARTKPGALTRPGSDMLLKDISFIHESRFMSTSRKLHFA